MMGEYLLGFLLGHWTLVLGRAEQTDVCVLADLRGGGQGRERERERGESIHWDIKVLVCFNML